MIKILTLPMPGMLQALSSLGGSCGTGFVLSQPRSEEKSLWLSLATFFCHKSAIWHPDFPNSQLCTKPQTSAQKNRKWKIAEQCHLPGMQG